MDIASLQNGLTVFEQDDRIGLDPNLRLRQTAFEFISVAEDYLHHLTDNTSAGTALKHRLTDFKSRLTEFNSTLFKRLRIRISSGAYQPDSLRTEFNRYTEYAPYLIGQPQYGLDGLDLLLNGIFEFGESTHRPPSDPEMVRYEPTPARLVLELIDRAGFTANDVFYDLGSGLGRVVLLVTLLSKIVTKGIEFDPNLQATAEATARALRLRDATFIHGDARTVDFSDGTVFFLFTPFKGEMFRDVLLKLHERAESKSIKLFSYGASNFWLAAQPWLHRVGTHPINDFSLTYYESNL